MLNAETTVNVLHDILIRHQLGHVGTMVAISEIATHVMETLDNSDDMRTQHHKLGTIHHHGKVIADAYKSDMSGETVSLYESPDKSSYTVVVWDKYGEFEQITKFYDDYDNAMIKYISLAFNR